MHRALEGLRATARLAHRTYTEAARTNVAMWREVR